jgi:outer membrane protein assembly factor BamB
MTFCTKCASYLTPEATSCPSCGASRPRGASTAAVWSAEPGGPPAEPPLVVGDLLLVATQEPGPTAQHSTLHALNLANGSPLWQRSLEHALVNGVAQLPESSELSGSLIATSSTDLLRGQGMLLAVDTTGNELWRWAPGVQRVSAPAVAGDAVCVTCDAQTLVILDLETGAERTRISMDESASTDAPAVTGQVAYIPCRGPRLLAVGLDGQLQWRSEDRFPAHAWLDQTPVIVGAHLFSVLGTGTALALRLSDGRVAWQTAVGPQGKRLSPPATDGERLYIGARDGLHALDLADGHPVWTFSTPRRIEATPRIDNGVAYATCHDHHLYLLDTHTGQALGRYEVSRRIEVSPAITQGRALVADRGGTITAFSLPLTAAEHEAAGRWVAAAAAYAAQGQLTQGAELLQAHGEPFKAAELWKAAGNLERAAKQYELANAWILAADLWEHLGRLGEHAEALVGHARSLAEESHSEDERAAAWNAAALVFEFAGETERQLACEREVARHTRQPIIAMHVEHEGLVLDAWSQLQFIVRNEGYGPAYNLTICTEGDQFEGQVMATLRFIVLRDGSTVISPLDVRPLQHGGSVPLRVCANYVDWEGTAHILEQTLYIPVARDEDHRGASQVHWVDKVGAITPSPRAIQLHKLLRTRLSLEELRTLCFDLNVPYDDLGGEGRSAKARELVLYLQRRNALPSLDAWFQKTRPDIEPETDPGK